jgi:hypothetical protein
MAAGALRALRPGVSRERIEELAMERWGLTPEETRAVGETAERMREVGGRTVTIEQLRKGDGMARSEGWTKVREATRRILTEHPGMDRTEAYEKVKAAAGTSMMLSSWQTEHYYPVRRQIEIEIGKTRHPARPRPKQEGPGDTTLPVEPVVPDPEPMPNAFTAVKASSTEPPITDLELRMLQRLGELEVQSREIKTALSVIGRFRD